MDNVIEVKNKERLHRECHKMENAILVPKTKTKNIINKIMCSAYSRKPEGELMYMTKNETKTILIARYGMLECGSNFKGSLKPQCDQCHAIDDENHRLNYCTKWCNVNFCNVDGKMPFEDIFSSDTDVLRTMVQKICSVWNVTNAHGTMQSQ